LLAESTCTANVFLDALPFFVLEETDDPEQKEEGAILFKQDSASPFFSHEIRNVLIARFPNRWIGTGGTTRGRHEDQTSYQCVLSVGFIKYLLDAEKSRDLSQL
jgi:hypothetical protein